MLENVAGVPSLSSPDLLVVFSAFGEHVDLLLDTLDLIKCLVWLGKVGAVGVDLGHKPAILLCIVELGVALLNIFFRILASIDSRVEIQALVARSQLLSACIVNSHWLKRGFFIDFLGGLGFKRTSFLLLIYETALFVQVLNNVTPLSLQLVLPFLSILDGFGRDLRFLLNMLLRCNFSWLADPWVVRRGLRL